MRRLLTFPRVRERRAAAFEMFCEQARNAVAAHDSDHALLCYDKAIATDPSQATGYYRRANLLKDLGRHAAAIVDYDAAIGLNQLFSFAHCNRGVVLQAMARSAEALLSYERALALDFYDAIAHYNRALLLQDLDRWEEALASYDRAIEVDPDYADAHFNRALALLYCGEFQHGLREFEWRWQRTQQLGLAPGRAFPQPLWLGDGPLEGKRLLLHAEAGLGDTLQFCRFATLAARRGAHVILEVQPPLVELLSTLEGVAQAIPAGCALPEFDMHCPIMSLPLAFETTLSTIPASPSYLQSDPKKVAMWQARLPVATRPRVGLVWSGNSVNRIDSRRSIKLAELVPHLPTQFEYYSLQKDVRQEDEAILTAHPFIRPFPTAIATFSETAAYCACLDLVISVDTSVAHLNAALGGRTWLMLPRLPDWRWLRERSDSPWYPTMTLYRQRSAGDWHEALSRMAANLTWELPSRRLNQSDDQRFDGTAFLK